MDDRYRAVRDVIAEAHGRATAILAQLRPHVEELGAAAFERRHLSGSDLQEMLSAVRNEHARCVCEPPALAG
jgi:hypothetical protein